MNDLLKFIGLGIAVKALYDMLKENTTAKATAKVVSPVASPKIRNDAWGKGIFGASRGNRKHNGIDLIVKPGMAIVSPITGKITRSFYPYQGDTKYRGCEIISDDGVFKFKLMYMLVDERLIGKRVMAGAAIGYAQDVSERYGGTMIPHLHFEVYKNQVLIDPAPLLGL